MSWPERLIDLRAEDQLRYRDRDVRRYARQIAAESRQDALAYLDHQKRLRAAQRTPGGRLGRFLGTVVWVWRGKRAYGRGKIDSLVVHTRGGARGTVRLLRRAVEALPVMLHQVRKSDGPEVLETPLDLADHRRVDMTQANTCSGCRATWTGLSACHCSGCHNTFAGLVLFDAHRTQHGEFGACRRPADMVMTSGFRRGEPVMFFREGIWRGPEMTEEQKFARFGDR